MLGYPTRLAHQLFGNIQTGGWIKAVLGHLYVRHPVSGSHMAAQKIESRCGVYSDIQIFFKYLFV